MRFFESVGAASPLPVVAYHNAATGADPDIEAWVRLAELPVVHAFKESSRDVAKIMRLIEEVDRPGHAAYLTTMQPLLTTLLMGGSGATMPPPATRIGARVIRAFDDGDLAAATRWQRVFSTFPGRWSHYGLAPVMKAAMRHTGVDIGVPVAPFGRLSDDDDRALRTFLLEVGVVD